MPRGKIMEALEQIAAESSDAFVALHRLRVEEWHQSLPYRLGEFYFNERYKHHKPSIRHEEAKTFDDFLKLAKTTPEKFLASIDEARLDMAYEAGIFGLPARYDFNVGEEAIEHTADKLAAASAHANRMSGHKFNSYRRRNGDANGRSNGNGFSYKPEIPYRSVNGVNVAAAVELGMGYRNFDRLHGKDGEPAADRYWDYSLNEVSRDYRGFDQELFSRPRYDRRNHSEQSMPKIDWQAEREWRNKRNYRRTKQNAAYLTSRESARVKESVARINESIDRNPQSAFGRTNNSRPKYSS